MATSERIAEARRLIADPAACRARRLASGLTLTEVAGELGVTPAALSRWERGLRRPRTPHALKWARLLRRAAA